MPNIENAVVKVFSTLRGPDPSKPWSKAAPKEITGSGVVIEGKRILTNAHVVGYASQVQIQASQAGNKLSATVVAVGRGIDLAILKLDDESFFDTHPPVARASLLPEVREAVFAYGYPTGGNSLSITKGIVSRIEFVPYTFANSGLRIQIDAKTSNPLFLLDEVRRHVACRVHHDADAHIVPPTPRFSAPTVPQLPCGCMRQSGMDQPRPSRPGWHRPRRHHRDSCDVHRRL